MDSKKMRVHHLHRRPALIDLQSRPKALLDELWYAQVANPQRYVELLDHRVCARDFGVLKGRPLAPHSHAYAELLGDRCQVPVDLLGLPLTARHGRYHKRCFQIPPEDGCLCINVLEIDFWQRVMNKLDIIPIDVVLAQVLLGADLDMVPFPALYEPPWRPALARHVHTYPGTTTVETTSRPDTAFPSLPGTLPFTIIHFSQCLAMASMRSTLP